MRCRSRRARGVAQQSDVAALQVRETAAENDKTQQGVLQNRQYQIDAAIVRVMKGARRAADAAVDAARRVGSAQNVGARRAVAGAVQAAQIPGAGLFGACAGAGATRKENTGRLTIVSSLTRHQASDLKKRIDSLLEREYLERSSADSGVYNYLS